MTVGHSRDNAGDEGGNFAHADLPPETMAAQDTQREKRWAQRRHPDLNRGMEVLQTSALPLGYAADARTAGECLQNRGAPAEQGTTCRAGDRARTGDPNLGKVVLYQLSYTRMMTTMA